MSKSTDAAPFRRARRTTGSSYPRRGHRALRSQAIDALSTHQQPHPVELGDEPISGEASGSYGSVNTAGRFVLVDAPARNSPSKRGYFGPQRLRHTDGTGEFLFQRPMGVRSALYFGAEAGSAPRSSTMTLFTDPQRHHDIKMSRPRRCSIVVT